MKHFFPIDQVEGDGIPTPPLRADATKFPYFLIYGSGFVFADTNTELLEHLIDGYGDIPQGDADGDDQALIMRYEQALAVATAFQSGQIIIATEQEMFNPADNNEESLTALFNERTIPFEGATGPDGHKTMEWDHDVPLVLIDIDYRPFTTRPQPQGNIVWMRPSFENDHLQSLNDIGLIVYRVLNDQATGEPVADSITSSQHTEAS